MNSILEPRLALWRYHLLTAASRSPWLLVVPVLAALASAQYSLNSQSLGDPEITRLLELVAPLVGAFLLFLLLPARAAEETDLLLLCAHRPTLDVVAPRLIIATSLALCTATVVAFVASMGFYVPVIVGALGQLLPAVLFLSTLVLYSSERLGNSLYGLMMAGAVWLADLCLTPSRNLLLGLTTQNSGGIQEIPPALVALRMGFLLLGALGFFLLYCRYAQAPFVRKRWPLSRVLALAFLLMVAYVASGALLTGTVAYLYRGQHGFGSAQWVQEEWRGYRRFGVQGVLGPAFSAYSSPERRSALGGGVDRITRLQQALEQAPHSLWADALAMECAREQASSRPWAAALAYLAVADGWPRSPLAPQALLAVTQMQPVLHGATRDRYVYEEQKAGMPVPAFLQLEAAERLLRNYPQFQGMSAVAEFFLANYPDGVNDERMMEVATRAASVGTPSQRPRWLLVLSGLQYRQGPEYTAEAAANARAARESAGQWLREQEIGVSDRQKNGQREALREIQRQAEQLLATSGEASPANDHY